MSKGFIFDSIVLIALLLSVGISIVIMMTVFGEITSSVGSAITQTPESQNALDKINTVFLLLGGAFVLFLFFHFIAIVISSFLVDANPFFIGVFIFLGTMMLIVAPILSNLYESVATEAVIVTYANQVPGLNFIMLNLPIITLGELFVSGLVIFGRKVLAGRLL